MKDKYSLLSKGLFPEVLPPAFVSTDIKRALRGLVPETRAKAFHKRSADYVRYNGTKHDGSRRYFGTPNPISYFYVSEFIHSKWSHFSERFDSSPFSVSTPRVAKETDDRAIIIPSLSELTVEASKKIGHSEFTSGPTSLSFFRVFTRIRYLGLHTASHRLKPTHLIRLGQTFLTASIRLQGTVN